MTKLITRKLIKNAEEKLQNTSEAFQNMEYYYNIMKLTVNSFTEEEKQDFRVKVALAEFPIFDEEFKRVKERQKKAVSALKSLKAKYKKQQKLKQKRRRKK